MRATLHDRAPNTYYGQWLAEKLLFAGLHSLAIAHGGLNASARFVTFDVPERDFPTNRSPPVGNLPVDEKEILRVRRSGALPATKPLTDSIQSSSAPRIPCALRRLAALVERRPLEDVQRVGDRVRLSSTGLRATLASVCGYIGGQVVDTQHQLDNGSRISCDDST